MVDPISIFKIRRSIPISKSMGRLYHNSENEIVVSISLQAKSKLTVYNLIYLKSIKYTFFCTFKFMR